MALLSLVSLALVACGAFSGTDAPPQTADGGSGPDAGGSGQDAGDDATQALTDASTSNDSGGGADSAADGGTTLLDAGCNPAGQVRKTCLSAESCCGLPCTNSACCIPPAGACTPGGTCLFCCNVQQSAGKTVCE
jgi:hypothetical protein